jgi:hypothetical protein
MDDSTLGSLRGDFSNLSLKPPQTDYTQSLNDFEPPDPQATYLDTERYDAVHRSTDETTTFAPDAAAGSFVSDVVTNPNHKGYAETADDVSGT